MGNNLIGRKIGIGDHFPADSNTDIMFSYEKRYEDIIAGGDEDNPARYGQCIKNQIKSDEWVKAYISSVAPKNMGKDNALYIYNVKDTLVKPAAKYYGGDDTIPYRQANGNMYIDFDDISVETVDEIERVIVGMFPKNHNIRWFERSFSGKGCHIRMEFALKLFTKTEWLFYYANTLNKVVEEIGKSGIDVSEWYTNNVIDWSCMSISRGFAIPYNEKGVVENDSYDRRVRYKYETDEELKQVINQCATLWHPEIVKQFRHKLGLDRVRTNEGEERQYKYSCDKITISHPMVSGEQYNYNWRLKLVTTLMAVFDRDKDKVRKICGAIYQFIKPYKNHTYNEMMHNELERKIFANANFDYSASMEIINELNNDWGFNIRTYLK